MKHHRRNASLGWRGSATPWILALALLVGPGGCKKKKAKPNPWARPLPVTTAAYALPQKAEATVRLSRNLLELDGRRLHRLKNGRLARTSLRDGVDGLFIPALNQALARLRREKVPKGLGRLAIHCQPAVVFRTLRAVLYTAMRAGFLRPWLVAEGPGKRRVALPLELPSATNATGHGLRASPPRIPALAVGVTRKALHITRWSRPACPPGVTPPAGGGCLALGKGSLWARAQKTLGKHLLAMYRRQSPTARPGRSHRQAIMVWAGLDATVGSFVQLLDATREPPGSAGTCKLTYQHETGRWQPGSAPLDPKSSSPKGCLYYQTILVWSRPGHRQRAK